MSEPKAPQLATDAGLTTIPATLHQWGISPFCYKVRMAAAAKGLRFERESVADIALLQTAKRETRLAKVPVVETNDGEWVTDSTAIAKWIDAKYPGASLYPDDPEARISCELLEDWADEALNMSAEPFIWLGGGRFKRVLGACADEQPSLFGRVVFRLFGPMLRRKWRRKAAKHGGLPATRALLESQLDLLERRLAGDPWLFGTAPTAADFAVAGQLANLLRFGGEDIFSKSPNVRELVQRAIGTLPEHGQFET